MKRITDLKGVFIRDDYNFNEETEFGLEVEPAQGLYKPKRDFETETWVEGATQEYIDSLKTQPDPTLEERLQALETIQLERILGGV